MTENSIKFCPDCLAAGDLQQLCEPSRIFICLPTCSKDHEVTQPLSWHEVQGIATLVTIANTKPEVLAATIKQLQDQKLVELE